MTNRNKLKILVVVGPILAFLVSQLIIYYHGNSLAQWFNDGEMVK